MPDTKVGRERKGRNKRAQLERHLAKRELRALQGEEEPPEPTQIDSEFLVDPAELDD